MAKQNNIFNLGETVYSKAFGKGKIVNFRHDMPLPIIAKFNDGNDEFLVAFTRHGWYNQHRGDVDLDIKKISTVHGEIENIDDFISIAKFWFAIKENRIRVVIGAISFITGVGYGGVLF